MANVLVIDDDAQVRSLLQILLEEGGHDVRTAGEGGEGLRLCRERAPDLVITDIIMPDREGLETIRDVRRDFPATKIIAISGGGRFSPENYLGLAMRMGANQVFSKPLDNEELLASVTALMADAGASDV